MKRIVSFILLILLFSISLNAREVTLSWDANSEPDLNHYVVYWDIIPLAESGSPSNNSGDIGLGTSYSLTLPDDENIYYFVVTAVDDAGLESDFSNEVNTEGITTDPPVNEEPALIEGTVKGLAVEVLP